MVKFVELATACAALGLGWWTKGVVDHRVVEVEREMMVPDRTALLHRVRVVPMQGKTMGAEVFGLDAAMVMDEQVAAVLQQALEKHLVLVLHNVSQDLTPEMHLRFARMFGPVDPVLSAPPSYLQAGVFNSPESVQRALARGATLDELGATMRRAAAATATGFPRELTRIVKEPSDAVAFGEGWHTDLSYRTAPPFAAILVSRDLPPRGGHTHFLDMRVALEKLPAEDRAQVEGMHANHTDGASLWSVHPMVRHDNKHGRASLFVNKAFTRHVAFDEAAQDSDSAREALLGRLLDHVETLPRTAPEAFLDVAWQPGQVVMWDNRFTQHAAQADYTERREMHRAIVSGTIPF